MSEAQLTVTSAHPLHGPTLEVQMDGFKLESRANSRLHFAVAAKRTRAVRERVELALRGLEHRRPSLPCTVVIYRVAPSRLDGDNMVSAAKPVVDQIASWLGLPNDRDPRARWLFGQHKIASKTYAVRIAIYAGQERCRCGAPLAGGVFVDPAR